MKPRGHRIALAASVLGLFVLALTAIAFRDSLTQTKATFGRTGGVLDPFLATREDGAMKPKGRRIAVTTASAGVLTIAIAAFVARERIAEEYWLCKLSRASGDEAKIKAIDKLGDLRSKRAEPVIMDMLWQMISEKHYLHSKNFFESSFRALDVIGALDERSLILLRDLIEHGMELEAGRIPAHLNGQ